MLTYFQIIQNHLNTQNIHYPIIKIENPKTKTIIYKINNQYWNKIHQDEFSIKTNENSPNIKMMFFIFMQSISKHINNNVLNISPETIIEKKYEAYKTIINNIFVDNETKNQIQTIFETTQRKYLILKSFIQKVLKKRREPHHKITTDLSLTPLNPNDKFTFIVYEQPPTKLSYLFSIHDLINIIKTAITNTCNFFEKPLQPKNPYTNVPLTKETLYSLFYKLYKINYNIPPILIKYYECEFNLKWFSLNNQMEIRDIAIKNYIMNSPTNVLHEEIIDMIDGKFYDIDEDISITNIDKEFPKQKLIEIMRPYLYLHLMSEYHLYGIDKKLRAKKVFKKAIINFVRFNPKFGERYIQINKPQQVFTMLCSKTETVNDEDDNSKISTTSTTSSSCKNTKEKQSKNIVMFFDEHPKFSMKDIEIYLQDPIKLKIIPPPPSQKKKEETEDEATMFDSDTESESETESMS